MYIKNSNSLGNLFSGSSTFRGVKAYLNNGVPDYFGDKLQFTCILPTQQDLIDLGFTNNMSPTAIGTVNEFEGEVELFESTTGAGQRWWTYGGNPTHIQLCWVTPITINRDHPKIKSNGNTPIKADCPCDCKEITSMMKVYLVKNKFTPNDEPVNVISKILDCTSKDSIKKYTYPCNTNQEKLKAMNSMQGLEDCPCNCEEKTINEVWYLTTDSNSGGIALDVPVTEEICNTPKQVPNRTLPCDEITNALKRMKFPVTVAPLNGLGDRINLNGLGNSGETSNYNPSDFTPLKKDTNTQTQDIPDCANQYTSVYIFGGILAIMKLYSII